MEIAEDVRALQPANAWLVEFRAQVSELWDCLHHCMFALFGHQADRQLSKSVDQTLEWLIDQRRQGNAETHEVSTKLTVVKHALCDIVASAVALRSDPDATPEVISAALAVEDDVAKLSEAMDRLEVAARQQVVSFDVVAEISLDIVPPAELVERASAFAVACDHVVLRLAKRDELLGRSAESIVESALLVPTGIRAHVPHLLEHCQELVHRFHMMFGSMVDVPRLAPWTRAVLALIADDEGILTGAVHLMDDLRLSLPPTDLTELDRVAAWLDIAQHTLRGDVHQIMNGPDADGPDVLDLQRTSMLKHMTGLKSLYAHADSLLLGLVDVEARTEARAILEGLKESLGRSFLRLEFHLAQEGRREQDPAAASSASRPPALGHMVHFLQEITHATVTATHDLAYALGPVRLTAWRMGIDDRDKVLLCFKLALENAKRLLITLRDDQFKHVGSVDPVLLSCVEEAIAKVVVLSDDRLEPVGATN